MKKNNRTKKYRRNSKSHTRKNRKTPKKWVTAMTAATKTFGKTKSLHAAREALRKQALFNAKQLFGSI